MNKRLKVLLALLFLVVLIALPLVNRFLNKAQNAGDLVENLSENNQNAQEDFTTKENVDLVRKNMIGSWKDSEGFVIEYRDDGTYVTHVDNEGEWSSYTGIWRISERPAQKYLNFPEYANEKGLYLVEKGDFDDEEASYSISHIDDNFLELSTMIRGLSIIYRRVQ